MLTQISIHTRERPQTFSRGIIPNVQWDNANAITLAFGDSEVTVYHLSRVDADLLHRIACMSDDERAALLENLLTDQRTAAE